MLSDLRRVIITIFTGGAGLNYEFGVDELSASGPENIQSCDTAQPPFSSPEAVFFFAPPFDVAVTCEAAHRSKCHFAQSCKRLNFTARPNGNAACGFIAAAAAAAVTAGVQTPTELVATEATSVCLQSFVLNDLLSVKSS